MNERQLTQLHSNPAFAIEQILPRPSFQAVAVFRAVVDKEALTGCSVPSSAALESAERASRDVVYLRELERIGYLARDMSKRPRWYVTQIGHRFHSTLPQVPEQRRTY